MTQRIRGVLSPVVTPFGADFAPDKEPRSRQATQKVILLLEDAVARDPSFVPPLGLLAAYHLQTYFANYDHSDARLDRARKAIDAAARLQPDAGEVHLARALLYCWGQPGIRARTGGAGPGG